MIQKDFLETVVAERLADVAALDVAALERAARGAPAARPFARALRACRDLGRLAVIAEIKRVSPALGALPRIADPAALARSYAAAGAAAMSVLTEPRHWGGSLDDLRAVRAAVEVPVLCKDVIVDERQVLAARAAGADAILLIGEALDPARLTALLALASSFGMGALVEAHEPEAFRRVLATGAPVVGVNARDLRHPTTLDRRRIDTLAGEVAGGRVLVAESGIGAVADAERLPQRVDAVLVGTALVTADEPAPLLRALAGVRRSGPR